jgi:hypothetical protein
MNYLLCAFILINSIFTDVGAFSVLNLPSSTPILLRQNTKNNLCSMTMRDDGFSRRDIFINTVKTLGFAKLIQISKACADEDVPFSGSLKEEPSIAWTIHKGPFSENDLDEYKKTDTGLLYKDIELGTGPMPNDGDAVTINMVGYIFESGDKWCNTYKGIPSYTSVIRAGVRPNQKFMKGLNEGVKTMQKGGKRVLIIPAYLAYQYTTIFSQNNPDEIIIPGGSNIVCYVEVVNFRKLE